MWGLLVCWLITLLAGCKTVRYVPVETVRTDSVHLMDSSVVNTIIHYKDSLRIKDSIVIVVDTAGNVLSKEKYHDERHTKDTERSNNETNVKEKDERMHARQTACKYPCPSSVSSAGGSRRG